VLAEHALLSKEDALQQMFLQHASYGTRQVFYARTSVAALEGNHRIMKLIYVCSYTAAGDTARQSELREGKLRFSSSMLRAFAGESATMWRHWSSSARRCSRTRS